MIKTHHRIGMLFLLLISFIFGQQYIATAQPPCDILLDTEVPVCRNTWFSIQVMECENCTYLWTRTVDGVTTEISSSEYIDLKISEETLFTVVVTDLITQESCTSDTLITVHEPIVIDFKQHQLTCTNIDNDNGNTASIQAYAGNEFGVDDYHYIWEVSPIQISPNDSSLAIGLKAHQNYTIKVIDSYGCTQRDTFWTKAYSNASVEIKYDPSDTIYVQNPRITLAYDDLTADSIVITSLSWDFDDGTEPSSLEAPFHLYDVQHDTTFYISLTVFNDQGCDTTFHGEVNILPVKLQVPNVFTPNGDNTNQEFVIIMDENPNGEEGTKSLGASKDKRPVNEYYESSRLIIFNRWGKVVYESTNYQNDWDGDNLSVGVYYYVLECHGRTRTDTYKGSLTLIR